MKKYLIKPIMALETYPMRKRILRPNAPNLSDVAFNDDTAETSFHFGVFCNDAEVPTGIVSYMLDMTDSLKPVYQLRGMAIHDYSQGEGLGKLLINESLSLVAAEGIPHFWCHARESAIGFYKKMGWKTEGELFLIEGVGIHVRMTYTKPYELKEEAEWPYL